jgi:hypothetical protein
MIQIHDSITRKSSSVISILAVKALSIEQVTRAEFGLCKGEGDAPGHIGIEAMVFK